MTSTILPPERYPFKPGEAVYYIPHQRNWQARPSLTPAVVVAEQPSVVTGFRNAPRVAIRYTDGRRVSVKGHFLAYRGYCQACTVPALWGSAQLVCPDCGATVAAVPPPDDLVLRIYPVDHATQARATAICLSSGCTWGEACGQRRDQDYEAFVAMLRLVGAYSSWWYGTDAVWETPLLTARLAWHAVLGDEAGFRAAYQAAGGQTIEDRAAFFRTLLGDVAGDGPGGPSRRLQLPPLDLVRPKDDSEPDGPCELTRWLEAQFRRAA